MMTLQIQSQTQICIGLVHVCLLSQVMMSSMIPQMDDKSSELSDLLHSGQLPNAPTTAESSSAPTDSIGSQSSESQGRDDY